MRISCGNKNSVNHIENQSLNAMYISPKIQNNFIKICGKIIQDNLVCKINAAKSFSVRVHETTDISHIEQLTLCIRYLDSVEITDTIKYVLREDFLKFVPVHSTTGQKTLHL
jgi:hypothetical protein